MGHIQDSLPKALHGALGTQVLPAPNLPWQAFSYTLGGDTSVGVLHPWTLLTFRVSMHFPVLQSQTLTWKIISRREGGLTPQVWHP